jgi:hypothetical protein
MLLRMTAVSGCKLGFKYLIKAMFSDKLGHWVGDIGQALWSVNSIDATEV